MAEVTAPLTDEQLDAWERAANEATPGPWRARIGTFAVSNGNGTIEAVDFTHDDIAAADMRLIASARSSVPAAPTPARARSAAKRGRRG